MSERPPARRVVIGPQESEAERVVSPRAQFEEEVVGASLRPRTFDEYVGQSDVVENLRIAISAARRREEPLEHVLFYGPPGLGKTTLAGSDFKGDGRRFSRDVRPDAGKAQRSRGHPHLA